MIKEVNLMLSPYSELYDILIPKDHMLRQLNEIVDFSFVEEALKDTYTLDNGRPGERPEVMFKYLMLKRMYELSDRDVVERARTDLAFKFFLGIAPEDDVINPSSLTKFRKLRMKDDSIMDLLITKSVKVAMDNGIKLSPTMIVDSTHTEARYNAKSAREYLLDIAKKLRKKVYDVDESYTKKMPNKPTNQTAGIYEEALNYCQKIVDVVSKDDNLLIHQNIKENLNLLMETIDDINEELIKSKDEDAKIGHKTADTSFFGYKTHLAMTPERIITAATVTSGEKPDGKELQTLVIKTKENGVEVNNIVGDAAYSGSDNIEYANENDIKLVSKLNPEISKGFHRNILEFTFNKDAGMFVCPAGHLAIKKALHGKKKKHGDKEPLYITYFFDVNKCKYCPLAKECGYKGGASRTYSHKLEMADIHKSHQLKQESEEYQLLAKERYKIEAKNAELKNKHGYNHLDYEGQHGMTLQAGVSIFIVNLKRILCLLNKKEG